MTWIVWLLVCFAAGILWADVRAASAGAFVWLGLGASFAALAVGARAVCTAATRTAWPGEPTDGKRTSLDAFARIATRRVLARVGRVVWVRWIGWIGWVGWIGLIGLAAGHERHASELERAHRGAAIVAGEMGRVHRIDARVAARRARAGGDEIELWAVRAADGAEVVALAPGSEREFEPMPEPVPGGLPERLLLRLAPMAREAAGARDATPAAENHAVDAVGKDMPAASNEAPAAVQQTPAAVQRAPAAVQRAPAAVQRENAAIAPARCHPDLSMREHVTRADALLWPGARVRLAVRIAPLRPTRNPGSPDRAHAYARRGIGAGARLIDPDWVVETLPERPGMARLAASLAAGRRAWRAEAGRRLSDCRPGDGLVRALALGDRGALDPAIRRRFSALGLAHLLSVSGLHVGFVAWPIGAGVARLRSRLGSSRRSLSGFRAPLLAAGLAGGAYAWFTGGNVPALRASASFALVAAARGLRIAPSPGALLALVGLGLLVGEPDRLFAVGARFSFLACAALIGAGLWTEAGALAHAAPRPHAASDRGMPAGRADTRPQRGSGRGASGGERLLLAPLRASLAVSLALLPLVELEGLPRAWLAPWVNLFAIPWTGLVVLPCALGAVLGIALVPASWGDAWLAPLVAPASLLEWAVVEVDAVLGETLPAALIEPDRAGRLPFGIGLVAIGLGLIALRGGRLARATLLWLVVGGIGLAPLRERGFGEARPRVVFFDVGQADAALIESGDAVWLIDSGSGPPDGSGGGTVLRALRALGVDRLDGLVISHGDLDHRGGALRLLGAMPVDVVWLPALPAPDAALEPIARSARERGIRVERMHAGLRRASGASLELEVLWPPAPACGRASGRDGNLRGCVEPGGRDLAVLEAGRNARSLVLRATLAGHVVLFPADVGGAVERRLMQAGALRAVDLLKVAHHGSRSSSEAAWLRALAPRLAIVSAPCDATRGLPSPVVLARLRAAGSAIAWTGRDGAVAVDWGESGEPRASPYAPARDCEASPVGLRGPDRASGERLARPRPVRGAR